MTHKKGCLLFDWGDTLMRVFPEYDGPMVTWPNVVLVAGVAETLELLHKDWFIALATNAQASTKTDILAAFEKVQVQHLIDEVFCYKTVGVLKPDFKFFEHISQSLNFTKSQIIMIGDSFQNDIEGATKYGFKGIWFNRSDTEVKDTPAIKTIFNFSDLPEALNLF